MGSCGGSFCTVGVDNYPCKALFLAEGPDLLQMTLRLPCDPYLVVVTNPTPYASVGGLRFLESEKREERA